MARSAAATLAQEFLVLSILGLSACGGGSSGGDPGTGPPTGQAVVVRGPQIGLLTETSVLIAWRSDRRGVGSVEYEAAPGDAVVVSLDTPALAHVVGLDGLKPGVAYEYRVLIDGEVASEGHSFTTVQADSAAPFRFVAFGDSGDDTVGQREVTQRVAEASPELVLITGDVIYERGAEHELDPSYFVPYAHLIDRIPFYPALGNHDVQTGNGQPLLDALYLPRNDADGSERYYSLDRGEVHFVALDSTTDVSPGSLQHSWLRDDLAQNRSRWVVLYFHHPPYSSSLHGSDPEMQAALAPVTFEHRVDLVLSGHDHNYERTFPLLNGDVVDAGQEPRYTNSGGTIFIVTGGGGRRLYFSGRSAFTAYSESVHHHVQIDVTAGMLSVRAVRADGSILDEVWIEKDL